MDEVNAFEHQLARVARQKVGPLQPADVDHVVQRAVQSRWPTWPPGIWRVSSLTAAAAVVVLAAGFLLTSLLRDDPRDEVPAQAPSASATEATLTTTEDTTEARIVVAEDGSGDHTTITDAVEAAKDGDTILIRPGSYRGGIIVDKSVTIVGDGPRESVVVDVASNPNLPDIWFYVGDYELPYGFWVRDSATLLGLTVASAHPCPDDYSELGFGAEPFPRDWCAVAFLVMDPVERQGAVTLDGIATDFTDHPGSALMADGRDVSIRDSVLDAPVSHGGSDGLTEQLRVDSSVSMSVLAIERSDVSGPIRAAATSMRDSDIGATVRVGDAGVIVGNSFASEANVEVAIVAEGGTEVIVLDNTFVGAGIRYEPGSVGSIADNSIRDARTGIQVEDAEVEIIRNRISEGGVGVEVVAGDAFVCRNVIFGNAVGVRADGPTAHPYLIGNDISMNGEDLQAKAGGTLDDQQVTAEEVMAGEDDPCPPG